MSDTMNGPTPASSAHRVAELLELGETYWARLRVDEALKCFKWEEFSSDQLQIFGAALLFDCRFPDRETGVRQNFAELWAPAREAYLSGFERREYLGRLLWVSELLICNGLGTVAYWLLQSEIGMLWAIMREATRQLLEEYKAFPGFEIFHGRLLPMLRTPGPTPA